ncbi:MAG: sensor histidine kinase [Flavobacteriales bacterium]
MNLLFVVNVNAQEVLHNSFALSEGLMSQTVYCTTQSSDGYMWFGTDAGVSRFDGLTFEHFTTDDGLCDNEVLRIKQDSKGRIWFLSLSGCLAYFFNGKITSAINDQSLQTEIQTLGTTCFAEDKMGAIWFSGMDNRVVRFFNNKTEVYELDAQKVGGVRSNIYMFHDEHGDLFLQDHMQIGFLNERNEFQTIPNNRKRPLPNCFFDSDGGSYAIVFEGLYDFKADAMIHLPQLEIIPDLTRAIGLTINDESVWIPSGDLGVYHWIKKDNAWVFDRKYFDKEWVNFIFEDDEHTIWFCTRDHGIYSILPHRSNQFYADLEEEYQATTIARGKDCLFFGTGKGKIYKVFPNDGNRIELFYDFKLGSSVEDLIVDTGENLVVRTSTNAYIFLAGDATPIDLTNMHPKVLHDGSDGRLYLSMLSGISYLEKSKLPGLRLESLTQIPAGRIYNICVDDSRRLWFENHDRLFYLKDSLLFEASAFNAASRGRISTITKTDGGDILISTMGSGLYVLNDEVLTQSLSRENGLPSNECEWVRVFGKTAFLLTSAGLVRLDINDHSLHLTHHYSAADGMPDAKIYDVIELNGVLYLATHKGLYFLPSLNSAHHSASPRVHITDIWCNGIKQAAGDIRIAFGENLKMDFTAIAFDMPEYVVFQYTFGLDKGGWTTTSNRSIEISSLDWGEQVFLIRARKYDSDWSEPVSLRIYVLPPLWATWWFRVILAVVLAGAVYLLFVSLARRKFKRRLRILEQEQALLKERNRISTDLHDDIGAELSNIVILSRIARSRIASNDNPSDYIRKIDVSASDVISKMNGIIWSLNPSNDNLQNLVDYVRRYVQDFLEISDISGKVIVSGEADKSEIKALVRRNTFLIVKEGLHNISKHARATETEVKISIFPDYLIIEIADNGVGFDLESSRPEGLGLGSMKKRTADMGGNLEIKSTSGRGTALILKIPK